MSGFDLKCLVDTVYRYFSTSTAAILTNGQFCICRVPSCPKCDTGILKPYVVFFGDNVPKPRVEFVRRQVEQSDALLVVGSSLYVFSGYRWDAKNIFERF